MKAAAIVAALLPLCHGFQPPRPSSLLRRRSIRQLAVAPEDVSDKNFDLAVIGAGPVGVCFLLLVGICN